MKTHNLRLAVAFTAVFVPKVAVAQQDVHQTGAAQSSTEMAQCARVQPVVDRIISAAMVRLESARLSNNPADMRAAVDHLQAGLRDVRAQLAPCAVAATAADPHAGQTMPGSQPSSPAPAPVNPTPASTADPHAGHGVPAAPPAIKGAAAPKPAPSRPQGEPTADPHAGHGMPAASSAPKSEPPSRPAPSKPGPSKPAPAERADQHAGHTSDRQSGKQMDPVNGLMVDPASSPRTTYQGQTYYFSSEQTRKEFLENPAKFAKKPKG